MSRSLVDETFVDERIRSVVQAPQLRPRSSYLLDRFVRFDEDGVRLRRRYLV